MRYRRTHPGRRFGQIFLQCVSGIIATDTAEVLQVIGSSVKDTVPVFERILDSCERLFGTAHLGIVVAGDDGLVRAAAVRVSIVQAMTRTLPRPIDASVTGRVVRDLRVLQISDMAELARSDGESGIWARRTLGGTVDQVGNFSAAWAPMVWEDRGVGSIVVLRQPPRPFSDKELSLLKTFADQAVIAIQNARMFNDINEALEQQRASAEILSVISSSVANTQRQAHHRRRARGGRRLDRRETLPRLARLLSGAGSRRSA